MASEERWEMIFLGNDDVKLVSTDSASDSEQPLSRRSSPDLSENLIQELSENIDPQKASLLAQYVDDDDKEETVGISCDNDGIIRKYDKQGVDDNDHNFSSDGSIEVIKISDDESINDHTSSFSSDEGFERVIKKNDFKQLSDPIIVSLNRKDIRNDIHNESFSDSDIDLIQPDPIDVPSVTSSGSSDMTRSSVNEDFKFLPFSDDLEHINSNCVSTRSSPKYMKDKDTMYIRNLEVLRAFVPHLLKLWVLTLVFCSVMFYGIDAIVKDEKSRLIQRINDLKEESMWYQNCNDVVMNKLDRNKQELNDFLENFSVETVYSNTDSGELSVAELVGLGTDSTVPSFKDIASHIRNNIQREMDIKYNALLHEKEKLAHYVSTKQSPSAQIEAKLNDELKTLQNNVEERPSSLINGKTNYTLNLTNIDLSSENHESMNVSQSNSTSASPSDKFCQPIAPTLSSCMEALLPMYNVSLTHVMLPDSKKVEHLLSHYRDVINSVVNHLNETLRSETFTDFKQLTNYKETVSETINTVNDVVRASIVKIGEVAENITPKETPKSIRKLVNNTYKQFASISSNVFNIYNTLKSEYFKGSSKVDASQTTDQNGLQDKVTEDTIPTHQEDKESHNTQRANMDDLSDFEKFISDYVNFQKWRKFELKIYKIFNRIESVGEKDFYWMETNEVKRFYEKLEDLEEDFDEDFNFQDSYLSSWLSCQQKFWKIKFYTKPYLLDGCVSSIFSDWQVDILCDADIVLLTENDTKVSCFNRKGTMHNNWYKRWIRSIYVKLSQVLE